MNHRTTPNNCREKLVGQLFILGEEKRMFLDAYFDVHDRERIQLEKQLITYTHNVEQLLAGPDEQLNSVVLIGSQVELEYIDFHTSDTLTIVMPEEADPDTGKISFLSPVGRQLLLGSKGEVHSLHTPSGSMRVRISNIDWKQESQRDLAQGGADYAL